LRTISKRRQQRKGFDVGLERLARLAGHRQIAVQDAHQAARLVGHGGEYTEMMFVVGDHIQAIVHLHQAAGRADGCAHRRSVREGHAR
jgi:hypothetical protein